MHETRYTRIAQTVNFALLILLLGGSLLVYPFLPDQIPTRINPDSIRYSDTTLLSWLGSLLLPTLITTIPYGVVHLKARTLQHVLSLDFPKKDLYRTLSIRHKRIVADMQRAVFHGLFTPVLVTFVFERIQFYLLAMSFEIEPFGFMTWWKLSPVFVGIPGVSLGFYWWISRSIQRFANQENHRDFGEAERSKRPQTNS
jgi:uncharacterized membrane protein